MLQFLLAARFRLAAHHQAKSFPTYTLQVAKGGPKLRPSGSEDECPRRVGVVPGGQSDTMEHCAIGALVEMLSGGVADRPVLDETGLTGKYDFQISVTPAFMRKADADIAELNLSTALAEPGLSFQKSAADFDVVVVDHAERPSTN